MEDKASGKAHYIKAYFDDLRARISFLGELDEADRKNEALMLCCCYIEALGNRQSEEPGRAAKNYCKVLAEHGKNEIWQLIHPKQLKKVLSANGLFKDTFSILEPIVDKFGAQLVDPKEIQTQLDPSLNTRQRARQQSIQRIDSKH